MVIGSTCGSFMIGATILTIEGFFSDAHPYGKT